MTEKIQKGRFTPWCWEAERDEYNDRSRRGWHLKKRSLRDMSYEYDPSVQYRYALDYRRQHNEEFYLEFFAEDGWELVGTVTDAYTGSNPGKRLFVSHWDGCWYIFRKPYRPGSPEADYEIATDEASLSELQNTLHRKYRRLMIWEALWLIGYLAVHLTMDQSRFIFSDYILLAAGGLCFLSTLYRWLCVRVLRPRKALRIFVDYRAIACVLLTLCFLLLLSLVISDSSAPEEPDTVPVTAANTPAQLFLQLRADLSVEKALQLAEEYGLKATGSYNSRYGDDGEIYHLGYILHFAPDPGEEYTQTSSVAFSRGVALALVYDSSGRLLQSAYLSMNTDNGRAYCHYFPGEPGVDGCETGYNLFLRTSALSRQRYYHAESPEEILSIAYPVLYPDGLA